MNAMENDEDPPFILIIYRLLYNYFLGPVPTNNIFLSLSVEREDICDWYDSYVNKGIYVEVLIRSKTSMPVPG